MSRSDPIFVVHPSSGVPIYRQLIDQVEAMVQRAPNQFALARSAADIRNNHAAGRISLPLGMENGAALEGDLASLVHFRDRGIRYITLAHA